MGPLNLIQHLVCTEAYFTSLKGMFDSD